MPTFIRLTPKGWRAHWHRTLDPASSLPPGSMAPCPARGCLAMTPMGRRCHYHAHPGYRLATTPTLADTSSLVSEEVRDAG